MEAAILERKRKSSLIKFTWIDNVQKLNVIPKL